MRRFVATLHREVVLQARYRFYAISLVVVAALGGLALAIPAAARPDAALAVPGLLLANLLITTFYFAAGLALLERTEGTLLALAVSPLRPSEHVAARAVTLTALGVAETLAVAAFVFDLGVRPHWLLLGAAGLGTMYAAAGLVAVARYDSINAFLMPSVVFVTAVTLPLLPHLGLLGRLPFLIHPAEPALTLMRAAYRPLPIVDLLYGLAGTAAWAALALHLAARLGVKGR